ncbi:MAG: ATP-binding protein [Nevskiales bacterium]|nr:ATP-binding protein [Nevskiales bacterium]
MFGSSEPNSYRILRVLARLRLAVALLQAATIVAVGRYFDGDIPVTAMLSVPASLLGWNLLVWWRLGRWRYAAQIEVVSHLAVDIAALTALLWLSGGPGNPFVSLYLLPIALAAASLSSPYAWTVMALCTGAYTGMLWAHIRPMDLPGGEFFHWHVVGMWVNFVLGAALLTGTLGALAAALRRREADLATARESALQDERILATGALAAGTAHELNTPLSTMAVLIEELRQTQQQDTDLQDDLGLLADQIEHCRRSLRNMLSAADPARHGPEAAKSLREFLHATFDRWRLIRPEPDVDVIFEDGFHDPRVIPQPTLAQALTNLLNNAADASAARDSDHVGVRCRATRDWLSVIIDDDGPGLPEHQLESAARGLASTKPDGFGLGLVLSNTSIARLGGEVQLFSRPEGGLRTQVRVPLSALQQAPG